MVHGSAYLYGPVQDDLHRVESYLLGVAKVDYAWLADLVTHTIGKSGKRIRPALTLLAGTFYDYRLDLLIPMASAAELLHTATLVHDDMLDNATTRRGRPTVNSLWSAGITVLLGDYLFANSAELVSRTANVRVMRRFAQTLMTICNGELAQNFMAFECNQTREDYYQRIGGKTAALFAMATECGAALSAAPEEVVQALERYGYNLGMAFQIADDILDFMGDAAEMGKPVGSDLLQGTLTLPALLLLEQHPQDNPIQALFAERDPEANLQHTLDLIRRLGIIEQAYAVAREFSATAVRSLTILPDTPARHTLEQLADYVLERRA
ncbi:MAG: polyprenyl synthetase family protein [Chloroflexi bacterium]|nr:polyprenyl synthetase family protein [Chloroflexota bacterium]